MLTWGYAVDGFGFRLTNLVNSLVPGGINFLPWRWGSVTTFQHPTPRETDTELAEEMSDAGSNFADLDNFEFKLGSGATDGGGVPAYVWSTYGTVINSGGRECLLLRPKVTMAAFAAPTTVLRAVTLEYLLAPIGGDAANCRIRVPGTDFETWDWNDPDLAADIYLTGGKVWSFPGRPWSGGENGANEFGDLSHLPYDEPKGVTLAPDGPTFQPDLYIWNDGPTAVSGKTGFCARMANQPGYYSMITLKRLPDGSMFIAFTWVPQDCSVGINNQSDLDSEFSLELRPMVGEDWDFDTYCAVQEEAENSPAFENGTFAENPLFAQWVRSIVFLGYLDGGSFREDFSDYEQIPIRLKNRYGLGDWEVAMQVYDHQAGLLGLEAPVMSPFKPTAAAALLALNAAAIATFLYSVDIAPQLESAEGGLPAGLGINADMIRTRASGYTIPPFGDFSDLPISGENPTPGVGSDEGNVHTQPNFLNPTNNEEYLDASIAENSEVGTAFRGRYADGSGVDSAGPDDNANLTPAQRSVGSREWPQAMRDFFELGRERMVDYGLVDPVQVAEFPNPATTIGRCEIAYLNPINPAGGVFYPRGALGAQVRYGRHMAFSTYFWWGAGPSNQFAAFHSPNWANMQELFNYTYSFCLHFDLIPQIQAILSNSLAMWIKEPGEARYLEYVAQAGFYEFLGRLFVNAKDVVKETRFARRLRELQSSPARVGEAYRNGGVNPQVPANKVMTSIKHVDTLGRDEIVIRLSNFSLEDGNPATVMFQDTINLADWPALGAGVRNVYLYNWRTKATLRLPDWDGSSHTFHQQIPPEFVGSIHMVPDGDESDFFSHSPGTPNVTSMSIPGPIVTTGVLS